MTAEPYGIAMIAADVEMKERKAKERKKMQNPVFNFGIVNTFNFFKKCRVQIGKKVATLVSFLICI